MRIDDFLPKRERTAQAKGLVPRDDQRTPVVVVSVAHLDDDERTLVLGVVLEQFLAWVRAQSGTEQLRALLVFDEIYGFVPPHPANPPTKRPLVQLIKQGHASARNRGVTGLHFRCRDMKSLPAAKMPASLCSVHVRILVPARRHE